MSATKEQIAQIAEIINRIKRNPIDLNAQTINGNGYVEGLTEAGINAALRNQTSELSEAVGSTLVYVPSDYFASGRGAFGRLKGGNRSKYTKGYVRFA